MTEESEIPNNRCGFVLTPADIEIEREELVNIPAWDIYCWRETWRETGQCIWHAKVDDKPVEELKAARIDGRERLDGAYLAHVDAGDDLSFSGCELRMAVFTNGNFSATQFYDAILSGAAFHGADLNNAQFHEAELIVTEFYDAKLNSAEFYGASLLSAVFHDSSLVGAQFHDASLFEAEFDDALMLGAEFHNAKLRHAEFHQAYLSQAQFHGADLTGADYTDADAFADFSHATLHNTLLTRADCRGATFTGALLYETVFADTRINSQTTFHDPEASFYNSITSRPAVIYEENPHTSEDLPEDTHPLKAAEWVYRRLEKLHNENALSEDAREFHISKEEAQRKYQRELGEYVRYAVSTLQWYVTGHGESIPRIFASAACLILVCGIAYPLVGGFESSSTGAAYRIPLTELHQVVSFDGAVTVLQGIYFSVITFTTIGYGDLYPTGAGSKLLVGFESLSGAILIALFVFVLGRRVAR